LILFVSGEYPPDVGGIGDYTARLRAELDTLGRPSQVMTRQQAPRWDARALAWLVRHAPRSGIVHIQYQPAAFDLLGDVCLMPLVLRATRGQVRVVTTFHDARVPFLFRGAGRLRPAAVRVLARTSHAVLAADERDLRWLGGIRRYQVPIGSNVACRPPAGYSRSAFRSTVGLAEGDLLVAYFGLVNASKGLHTLIDALGDLPDVKLMLLGGGVGASDPTDRTTASAIEPRLARLGARVVQTGYLEPAHLSAHLLAADVAVLPYIDGASPRRGSLLACAEHGLPIVSTEPVSEAVADAVYAVPPHDAHRLAEAVLAVASDPALAQRLRTGSAALAQRTSWQAIARQHASIYGELEWPRR
jgi:glycosyltransferase involved in cell wall biosynthesis